MFGITSITAVEVGSNFVGKTNSNKLQVMVHLKRQWVCEIGPRCQFHQQYTYEFFVRMLFFQLRFGFVEKFVRKMRAYTVGEIGPRTGYWSIQKQSNSYSQKKVPLFIECPQINKMTPISDNWRQVPCICFDCSLKHFCHQNSICNLNLRS